MGRLDSDQESGDGSRDIPGMSPMRSIVGGQSSVHRVSERPEGQVQK